ncbi:hypothetical protein CAEBREN_20061 [Caenorhabditis brenneri]|uniref:Uncharacterized protein n=1 Tax=Caenorhabditis brenneri TaxID=135651 RepID=G0M960_CAEBE|nr:hypothetical protein CAEBREN_20061 [Caenorhabditis brenneri]
MSQKPTITTSTFKPEAPLKPAAYVDQLIKVVQKMAPHASRTQWNRFGIAARNIELSHEFHMGAIAHASTTSSKPIAVEDLTEEFVEARLKSCQKELEFLAQMMRAKAQESADLQTLLQHFDEFGSPTAASSSDVSKNSGI